nr:retron system putative HNH endonuclease [uncultured Macellibacteroides sp.]
MRYIKKKINSKASALLLNWIKERKKAKQSVLYSDFDRKEELNGYLRSEQKGICCYCQQPITHFQKDSYEGSHNEHFIPENGIYGRPDLQMEYMNIYASCNYSKGKKPSDQHCGEAKHDSKIDTNFLQKVSCHSYFKYNTIGEIVPSCPFLTIRDCEINHSKLTPSQQEAFKTIKVLNLNQTSLVALRKKEQTILFEILNKLSKDQINARIQLWNNSNTFPRFIDMLLYYMKLKK